MAKKQYFENLLGAMQESILKAHSMIENQHLNVMKRYFDESQKPLTFDIQYPRINPDTGELEYVLVQVPKIALVPMNSLKLKEMKLKEAARKVEDNIEETLTYCDFPYEHWTRIRTNNVIERLNREIRRRTRVMGTFPGGNSALMLVCARLRHVAGTQWGNKKHMNMKHLETDCEDVSIAG